MTTTRRRATYPAARRIARLVHELPAHPHGWSFDAIQSELSIGERTLARYVEACRAEIVDAHGEPLIEVVQRGPRRLLRMRAADALRKGVLERVPLAARAQLARLDRKFFAVSFVPKDYAEHSDTLDEIVQALIYEFRLTIDYAGVLGEGKEHDLEPYTLLSYRGGLYLVGRSLLYERVIWLAVERIRGVKYTPGDGPRGRARFTYPREFHPERYTDGMFGVVDGPETEVELAIANTQTEAYLSKRTVHPSQRFERSDDGRLRLVMTVRGTVELANWIMGLTPWVEVVRPSELREEIAARCRDAVRGYER